jgi:hypothetical protein
MIGLLGLVTAMAAAFAATPQRAALDVFGPRATVTRTNIAGPYAIVFTSGGSIEEQPDHTPLLLKHFSFGWQPLHFVDALCDLEGDAISPVERKRLRVGVVDRPRREKCSGQGRDIGSAADVEAIRRLSDGPLTPYVAVSGDYGFLSWYGAGGGEDLFKRNGRAWKLIVGGGGAFTQAEARSYGVPTSAARVFGLPASFETPKPDYAHKSTSH